MTVGMSFFVIGDSRVSASTAADANACASPCSLVSLIGGVGQIGVMTAFPPPATGGPAGGADATGGFSPAAGGADATGGTAEGGAGGSIPARLYTSRGDRKPGRSGQMVTHASTGSPSGPLDGSVWGTFWMPVFEPYSPV